ncbi:efflux RND transporter periplasmic adaptor subunit [Rheinheimera riviphila]|uniref:Efflux RND transporter periplasmic adaptor subunit n=1 Tax=Rheinheimera riviphila TaxID=1834037 RepID=A0A437R5F4_9GAMM|nr:efflux RND transporter periplasmic adaptor subunit [Rheinheimera riviphila]RVU41965.1 efflux RND transporter periplasmic adaptor subunit [Rheinheimera riviphila]
MSERNEQTQPETDHERLAARQHLVAKLHQFEGNHPPPQSKVTWHKWLGLLAILSIFTAVNYALLQIDSSTALKSTPPVVTAAVTTQQTTSTTSAQAGQPLPGAQPEQSTNAADDLRLEASGYAVAPDSATVSSNITGRVSSVLVELGDKVTAGQAVATLDDRQARIELNINKMSLQSELAMKKHRQNDLQLARIFAQRAETLQANKAISSGESERVLSDLLAKEIALEQVEQSVQILQNKIALNEKLLEDLIIRAPFNGTVTALSANVGEIISPVSAGGTYTRSGICTIADMEGIEFHFDVNERFLPQVSQSQLVEVSLVSDPSLKIKARVKQIAPTTDNQTGTVVVIVEPVSAFNGVNPGATATGAFYAGNEQIAARPPQQDPAQPMLPAIPAKGN